jgi:hypothetical protein
MTQAGPTPEEVRIIALTALKLEVALDFVSDGDPRKANLLALRAREKYLLYEGTTEAIDAWIAEFQALRQPQNNTNNNEE